MAQKIKTANASTMTDMTRTVNHKQIDEWGRFMELNEEQKNTRNADKGVQIWLNGELKQKLDLMKANGLKYPVRYMLNAALRVFLESNEEEVKKYLP